jgi:hypothetical protein
MSAVRNMSILSRTAGGIMAERQPAEPCRQAAHGKDMLFPRYRNARPDHKRVAVLAGKAVAKQQEELCRGPAVGRDVSDIVPPARALPQLGRVLIAFPLGVGVEPGRGVLCQEMLDRYPALESPEFLMFLGDQPQSLGTFEIDSLGDEFREDCVLG